MTEDVGPFDAFGVTDPSVLNTQASAAGNRWTQAVLKMMVVRFPMQHFRPAADACNLAVVQCCAASLCDL